jgi:hypothetical protein
MIPLWRSVGMNAATRVPPSVSLLGRFMETPPRKANPIRMNLVGHVNPLKTCQQCAKKTDASGLCVGREV